MKIIVGVDGFDGSGKTSVTLALLDALKGSGVKARILGRAEADSDSYVAQMTDIVKRSDGTPDGALYGRSSLHLRLGRLAQRAGIAWDSPCNVFIWDRFLLSDAAALNPQDGREFIKHASLLVDGFRVIHLALDAPFPVLMSRIEERDEKSPKEQLGRQHLKELHATYQGVASLSVLPWEVQEVDASRSFEEVRGTVLAGVWSRMANPLR